LIFAYLGRSGVAPPKSRLSGVMMDGGCSWHISGNINRFIKGSMRKCKKRRIFGFEAGAEGIISEIIGDIEFYGMKDGKMCKIKIENVIYVPEMGDLTLISQGMLDKLDYGSIGKSGVVSMYDSNNNKSFEAHLMSEDGLYHCDSEKILCFNSSVTIDTLKKAHNTFGHISEDYLREIGEFEGKIGECSSCKKAKSTRRAYSKESKTVIPTPGHTIVR
jgi:hypothetical protein